MAREQAIALPILEPRDVGCGTRRPSTRGRKRAWALLGLHVLFLVHLAHWKVSGRTLSPLEPSEAGQTLTLGYVNAGFVLLVLLLVGTLVFGRFFCGWACHVVALQDASAWLLRRLGLRPRPLRSRFLAFVPLFAAFEMFALPSLLRALEGAQPSVWRWHLTTTDFWDRFPGPWMALVTFLVVGFLAVWMLGAKGFCTYGCPYGALFGLTDRLAPGRIRVTDDCEQCGHCTDVCTSNVRVHEEVARFGAVVDPGCMKCMDCVSVCPKDALFFGLRARVQRASARRRSTRTWDLSLGEDLVAALLFLGGLYAFRNLYGSVPFLLAIALAVLVAVLAIAAWRLVRRPSFTFQSHVWKRAGRWTPAGLAALGAMVPLFGFTAHSGLVQFHERQADAWLERAGAATRGTPERARALEEARTHLERALGLGLFETAAPHNKLGQLLVAQGHPREAEAHLLRAAALSPENRSARVYLADLAMARGDLAGALGRLEEIAALEPTDPELARRLQAVLARYPDEPRVRALAALVRAAFERSGAEAPAGD